MFNIAPDPFQQKKSFRRMIWFHLILWPLFTVFMVTQLGGMQYQLRWWGEVMREGTETIGIVLDVQEANTKSGQAVTVGFLSAGDRESKYKADSNLRFESSITTYEKGQLITLQYDPDKPWHIVLGSGPLEVDEEKWDFFKVEGLANPTFKLVNPDYADVLSMNTEDYKDVDQFDFSDLNIFL